MRGMVRLATKLELDGKCETCTRRFRSTERRLAIEHAREDSHEVRFFHRVETIYRPEGGTDGTEQV